MPHAPATHRPYAKPQKTAKLHRRKLEPHERALHCNTWQKFRSIFLDAYPLCTQCRSPGHERNNPLEVHHKIPRHERPDLMYDADNCLTLCRSCHAKVTREEQKNE